MILRDVKSWLAMGLFAAAAVFITQPSGAICENPNGTYWGCTTGCSGSSCCTVCRQYSCRTHEETGRVVELGDC